MSAEPQSQQPQPLIVMCSAAVRPAFAAMAPAFGHPTTLVMAASMGTLPTTIPNRLRAGEMADVLLMAGDALDGLIADGLAMPGSRVDIARSFIGLAVRAGAAVPDISTVDALVATLLAAGSIGYSASASGVYFERVMLPALGLAKALAARLVQVQGRPVASAVAAGEVEIGLQQISELIPVPGIHIVGPLPEGAQQVTVFSGGIAAGAAQAEAGRALLRFMAAAEQAEVLRGVGLTPMA